MRIVRIVFLLVAFTAAPAAAQTFTYGSAEELKEVKEVDWTATAEAGVLVSTGNAKTTTVTAAAKAQRLAKKDKLAAELGIAYARSRLFIASDEDMSGTITEDEVQSTTATIANSWLGKIRYDRFLTDLNSLYATAIASADRPAGKDLVAGGQIGYSRYLIKKDTRTLVVEAGYDFSYEDPSAGDGVAIHSMRGFVGYKGTIKEKSAVEASLEALSNLNTLDTPPEDASAFEDTRLNGALSLNSKITEAVTMSFSFGLKYDAHPSPRAPFSVPYDPTFTPLADKLDTITKATLIVSLF